MPLYSHSSHSILSDSNDKPRGLRLERQSTHVHKSIWNTKNSLYLVLLTVFEAIVVIVLESVILARFKREVHVDIYQGLTKGIPVYLVIFIFSLVFQVALAWDAVRNRNTIQIIALILFNLCCFSYAAFQFKQVYRALHQRLGDNALSGELQKLMIANPIVIGICQLAYFYLGTRLYLEFGWRIYKKIGADPDIRNMYRWYQIFLTILKIDFFFFLGFSIQYLVLVLQHGDIEYPLTIVALPLICVVLVVAVYAIKHESRRLIALFFLGLAAGIAYFIYKIYRIYDETQRPKYVYVNEFLTFFACVTLVLIVLTTVNAGICFYNFDRGLKAHLLRNMDEPYFGSEDEQGGRTLSLD
ncbi:hypothetical protein EDC96DRAFT_605201 [Choanephora cucurbitarum]|nr:hypothetical protein EDC96DRAFT_605201 [Choanephora cucurbitarum]